MKPGFTILNPNPSDIPKEEEILTCDTSRNLTILWDKKGVVLLKFLPRRTKMNSDPYSKKLRDPHAGLHVDRPTRKKLCMLPLCDNPELHMGVRTTESITNFG
jgi:hypothetical protein